MVIWFNNDKARAYLLKNKFVYTLRPKMRKVGREPLFWKEFKKKGMVEVFFIGSIDFMHEIDLNLFADYSGFSSLEEWKKEAKDSKFLYKVELLELI